MPEQFPRIARQPSSERQDPYLGKSSFDNPTSITRRSPDMPDTQPLRVPAEASGIDAMNIDINEERHQFGLTPRELSFEERMAALRRRQEAPRSIGSQAVTSGGWLDRMHKTDPRRQGQ